MEMFKVGDSIKDAREDFQEFQEMEKFVKEHGKVPTYK